MDVLLCDQKDTFCDIFISRLFWISVKTLLDLLMGVKKERRKQIRQKNLGRFAELGKNSRERMGFSAWITMASLGP